MPHCKHGQVTGLEGKGLILNSFLVLTVLSPVHPKSILFQKNTEKSLLERQILVPHPRSPKLENLGWDPENWVLLGSLDDSGSQPLVTPISVPGQV